MLIRRAREEDVSSVAALLVEAGEDVSKYGNPYNENDLLVTARHSPTLFLIATTNDHEVSGVLIAYDCACFGYVDLLYTSKKHRRSGVSKELVEFLYRISPSRWDTIEFCFPDGATTTCEWAGRAGCLIKEPVRWATLKH